MAVAGAGPRCTISMLLVCLSLVLHEAFGSYHILHVDSFRWNDQQELAKCSSSVTGPQQKGEVKGSSPGGLGANLTLHHIHGACSPLRAVNFTWTDFVAQILDHDNLRLKTIHSRKKGSGTAATEAVDVPLLSGTKFDTGNYIITAGFGTPTKNFLVTIDTGSDITWIQCKPCSGADSCYSQVDPIFDPEQSSSYKRLSCLSEECLELTAKGTLFPCLLDGCSYEVSYGDGSKTNGDFSRETLKIGPDSFPNFAFGCGHTNTGLFKGSAGLLGLGRDTLAFPAQTVSKYGGQFSYCLPDFAATSSAGSLSFGADSIPAKAVFTPLLSNFLYPSFYFVGLEGISVDGERLPLSAATFLQSMEGGGTIVDSGTIITRLIPEVYDALKASFRKKTAGLPSAQPFSILDTCYDLSKYATAKIPTITFHYQNNAAVDVSGVGVLVPVKKDASQVCLAFAPASQMDNLNIIGNFQQQRMRVAYDTTGKKIGFQPETSCSA